MNIPALAEAAASPPAEPPLNSWFKGEGHLPRHKDALFKKFENLPEPEQSIIRRSSNISGHPGQSGEEFYNNMDSRSRATLFNIFEKMKNIHLPSGEPIIDHVVSLNADETDRIFPKFDRVLLEKVFEDPNFHHRSRFDSIFHSAVSCPGAPREKQRVESFKQRYQDNGALADEGALELDFTVSQADMPKNGVWPAAFAPAAAQPGCGGPNTLNGESDIDEHAEILHHAQLFRHLIGEVAYNHLFHRKTNGFVVGDIERQHDKALNLDALYQVVPRKHRAGEQVQSAFAATPPAP